MKALPLVEIDLDRKRTLLIDHAALFRAEQQINKLRSAKPEEYAAIDTLMVEAYNRILRRTGLLPLDLLFSVLWAALLHEDATLKFEQIAGLMDCSSLTRAELSSRVWEAYFKSAGRNLVEAEEEEEPEKKKDQANGSIDGASDGSSSA